jgi:hypothetical protein
LKWTTQLQATIGYQKAKQPALCWDFACFEI